MISIWAKVTFVVGMIMLVMPIAHIFSMIGSQSSAGQSLLGACVWEVGILAWGIYGLFKKDWVLISVNSITFIVGIFYLATIINYG